MTTAPPFSGTRWQAPSAPLPASGGTPLVITQEATTDPATGLPTATFTPYPGETWLVRRITVQSDVDGLCYVYVGPAITPAACVSGTRTGSFDENDSVNGYVVPAGSSMFVQWLAGTPSSTIARIEYVSA